MMALLILSLLLAFVGFGAIALLGIQRGHSGAAAGGLGAMIFFAIQLGGAIGQALS